MASTTERWLGCRAPFDGRGLLAVLAARTAGTSERVAAGAYARTLRLARGPGVVVLHLEDDAAAGAGVRAELRLSDPRDEDDAVERVRRLLDLDADPGVIGAHLAEDPALAPLVARRPGLRVLGSVDGFELALRAVIGQQVSVAAARTVLGRIVAAHGEPVPEALHPGSASARLRLLPTPEVVAALPDVALPMPRSRAATVRRLATAVAAGEVDLRPGSDPVSATAALLALPGIGPWTAGYVAMRALGDRDAFPATDLVLRRSAEALGLPSGARALAARAERWSPWRAYAAQHLWAAA